MATGSDIVEILDAYSDAEIVVALADKSVPEHLRAVMAI